MDCNMERRLARAGVEIDRCCFTFISRLMWALAGFGLVTLTFFALKHVTGRVESRSSVDPVK